MIILPHRLQDYFSKIWCENLVRYMSLKYFQSVKSSPLNVIYCSRYRPLAFYFYNHFQITQKTLFQLSFALLKADTGHVHRGGSHNLRIKERKSISSYVGATLCKLQPPGNHHWTSATSSDHVLMYQESGDMNKGLVSTTHTNMIWQSARAQHLEPKMNNSEIVSLTNQIPSWPQHIWLATYQASFVVCYITTVWGFNRRSKVINYISINYKL